MSKIKTEKLYTAELIISIGFNGEIEILKTKLNLNCDQSNNKDVKI